jgi:sirohydrochlorin cobaltochelatase
MMFCDRLFHCVLNDLLFNCFMIEKPQSALVIVGHGSTVNSDSSGPTHAHTRAIRRRGCFAEVRACFWKEEPSLRQVLYMVESADIYVVPNFISEGYFTRVIIPRELELKGDVTLRNGRTIKYCDPVGKHPRMTQLLLQRAAEIAPGVPQEQTSLIVVGHGTTLHDNSAIAVHAQVDRIRAQSRYAEIIGAFMEEPPFIADWLNLTHSPSVVVVPFFVSDGLHSYEDIPVMLGIASEGRDAVNRGDLFHRNPHQICGRDLYYANAIGTETGFAEIILDQVVAFDAVHARTALAV